MDWFLEKIKIVVFITNEKKQKTYVRTLARTIIYVQTLCLSIERLWWDCHDAQACISFHCWNMLQSSPELAQISFRRLWKLANTLSMKRYHYLNFVLIIIILNFEKKIVSIKKYMLGDHTMLYKYALQRPTHQYFLKKTQEICERAKVYGHKIEYIFWIAI